jgi:hypothetical protein
MPLIDEGKKAPAFSERSGRQSEATSLADELEK